MKTSKKLCEEVRKGSVRALGKFLSCIETSGKHDAPVFPLTRSLGAKSRSLGITGSPGCGKSTLTSCLIKYWRKQGFKVGVLAVDPSSPVSGGALLGDRIRMMAHATDPGVFIRSIAARGKLGGLAESTQGMRDAMYLAGFERVIIETVGIGQSEHDISQTADLTTMILAPGWGDEIQLIKGGMLELADLLVVNKADQPGADWLTTQLEEMVRESGTPVIKTSAFDPSQISRWAKACDRLWKIKATP